MDTTSAPQIIEHQSMALDFTPYDTKWIPGTAKYVLGGQTVKATGIMKVFRLNQDSSECELNVGAFHLDRRGKRSQEFQLRS